MQESMRVISGGNTGNAARLWHTPLRTRVAVRPALRQGAALAVGLAGGWAVLYGALLPFGPGLALGLGEDCFAASAAGAALGLLLHGFGALSLQSICLLCGLGGIVAGRWLWPGRFLPAAAAGGAALACSAFCLSLGAEGGGVELLLFCGADALLAGAIGFGLRRFPPEKPGAGTLLPAMACAAALGSLALGPLVLGVAACAAAEYLLCCCSKYFAPGAFLCPCFHSGADIFLHVFGVASHVGGKLLRYFACKSCICLIGNFPCISEKSCLIFHLNRDDGSVCLIVLAHMLHHFSESPCIRLHGIL